MQGDGNGWLEEPDGQRHWGKYGAAGLLLLADDKILLQHRAHWTANGGTWALPGGAIDSHETAAEAAAREAFEEAGVADFTIQTEHITAGPLASGWAYTTVIATADEPLATTANEESLDLVWVPLDDVAQYPLMPAFASAWPLLRDLLEQYR